jgi:hypothetical protein
MKQLNLILRLDLANIKYFRLPIFIFILININRIIVKLTAVLNHLYYRFSPFSLLISQPSFANCVEIFTESIFPEINCETFNIGFPLTSHERNTESRLPESQLRANNFLNYGLLTEAASAASVTRASATPRCGVLEM